MMKHKIIKSGGQCACGPLPSFCDLSFCHSRSGFVGLQVSYAGRPHSRFGLVWLVRWPYPLHEGQIHGGQTAAVLAFRAEAIVKLTFCSSEPRGA